MISIDERGFGESGGTVRLMSPDQEGQDLMQILDWAEDLPGLRRRSNNEMYVGSFGGSYGGMYQFLLAGTDPKQRLRVLAPDITPHDLVFALAPNNVIKSGYVRNCGSLVLNDVQFAWFEEKLQFKKGAIDAALPTGKAPCLSLTNDDAIAVNEIKVGGTPFAFALDTPQFSGALGIGGALLGTGAREQVLADIPLTTIGAGGGVIAGVPVLNIELTGLSGMEMESCPTPSPLAPAPHPVSRHWSSQGRHHPLRSNR